MIRPFTSRDVENDFGPAIYKRGAAYFRNGRVRRVAIASDAPDLLELEGEVQGTRARPYHVVASWEGEHLVSECSCPYYFYCKHGAALLLAYLAQLPATTPEPESKATGWRELVGALSRADQRPPTKPVAPLLLRLRLEGESGRRRQTLLASLWVGDQMVPPAQLHQLATTSFPGARLLLNAVQPYLRGGSRKDGWSALPDAAVDEFLHLISTSNRVSDEAGEPLRLLSWEKASLILDYAREGEGAVLRPILKGARPDAGRQLQLVGAPRTWAWLADTLAPIEGAAVALLEGLKPAAISPEERPEFERRFLPDLAVAGRLRGKDLPERPTIKKGKPSPQLVLEESDGKLCGRMGFVYGGIRVEADEPVVHVGSPEGPWLARAKSKERKLLALMPPSKNPWESLASRFELKGDAALDFLIEDLPKLADRGIEVLGEDRLSSLKVSRGTSVSSFSVRSGIDWLGVEGGLTVDDEAMPWPAVWEAIASKRRYVRLGSGRFARLPEEWLAAQRPLLEALGVDWEKVGQKGGVRVPRYQAPLLDALLARADRTKTDQPWRDFSAKLRSFGGLREVALSEGFEGTLRPYQHQGLNFLSFLRDYGLHGILADDMGLGKTVQAAALLLENHAKRDKPPSLVIAPTSLVANWRAELARFAPALRTLVLHGPDRDFASIDAHDVVITTYATARLDLAEHQKRTYHTLILDEAQAIKNPRSRTAQAMGALGARHRLCLTGTPVENNLMELWSQFAFLMPGLLGKERDFKSRYANPIAAGDRAALAALKAQTAPFILRRMKTEVAKELPPRTDIVVWCELAPAQRRLYDTVLAASRARVMAAVAKTGVDRNHITILDALLKLRQVCCHPALLGTPETLHLPSAKLEAFLELVDELVEGRHRALVFSQFTTMLGHLRERLDERGVGYDYLDGRTKNRQAKVDRFNQGDTPLFLISLKAGGTGLNLIGADYVIHYDPWWNPAVEDQATDRAHRIGQKRQVFNYKLLAKDTVEEKLLDLQERKRLLVKDVLEADTLGKSLTMEDLRFLFGEAPMLASASR